MRLVCPNCGAQYEVDDRVIPDSGRDVQCSSCGHAWYQMPTHVDASEAPVDAEALAGTDDETGAGFEPEPEAELEPESETEEAAHHPAAPSGAARTPAAPIARPPAEDEDEGDDEVEAAPAAGTPPRRELDESLRAILQEEVAREMEARAASRTPEGIETQPDLGLDDAHERPKAQPVFDDGAAPVFDDDELPDISPVADAAEKDRPGAAAAAHASRRDLFPDIEEINSTLDRHGLPDETFGEETEERRGGFGRGFFAVIFIAALALALYLVAPQLARSVPALEPALSAYVGAVNAAREGLDALLRGATDRMGGTGQP